MGRPPSNGGPVFRFTASEVTEMEAVLQEHNNAMPAREILVGLAEKFSASADRKGKIVVQMKQVWNWFQNKRYAIRAKSSRSPAKLNISTMSREESTPVRNMSQPMAVPMPSPVPGAVSAPDPPASAPVHVTSVPNAGRGGVSDNCFMEFEAKSARDGAWYDVASFLSHRYLEAGDPEVLVRFAGFGPEEDEWVNVRRYVRQRSLPCESSECVAVIPGDLILCFQEGKEQALYFDAHVLDAQRRRHDVRGCRCRFLVRYDHDQTEEIVPLRKICRRPETDYRLQQLHALDQSAAAAQQKSTVDPSMVSAPNASGNAEKMQSQNSAAAINANTSGASEGQKDSIKSEVVEQKESGTSSPAVPSKSEVVENKASSTSSVADGENPSAPANDGVVKIETTTAAVGSGGNIQEVQM